MATDPLSLLQSVLLLILCKPHEAFQSSLLFLILLSPLFESLHMLYRGSVAAVRCITFGNALSSSSDALEIRSRDEFAQGEKGFLYWSAAIPQSAVDTPFVTHVRIDSRTAPIVQNGSTTRVFERSKVVFVSLDDAEVADMVSQYKEQSPSAQDSMPQEHKIVALLACQGAHLTIFQHGLAPDDKGVATLHRLRACFVSTMKMCRDHGLLWFYRLQRRDYTQDSLSKAGGWLLRKAWTLRSPPQRERHSLCPTISPSRSSSRLHGGWTCSANATISKRITMVPLSNEHVATAEFIRCEKSSIQFMVLVWLPAEYLDSESDLLPQIDSRVSISVTDGRRDMPGQGPTWCFEDGTQYEITIDEVDDAIPASRKLNALEAVAQSPSTSLVDSKSLLELTPHRHARSTGLKAWFDADSTRKEIPCFLTGPEAQRAPSQGNERLFRQVDDAVGRVSGHGIWISWMRHPTCQQSGLEPFRGQSAGQRTKKTSGPSSMKVWSVIVDECSLGAYMCTGQQCAEEEIGEVEKMGDIEGGDKQQATSPRARPAM
ncbi:hypothetical protein IWX49DRAFT_554675 [Phyllosticta citricarpa]